MRKIFLEIFKPGKKNCSQNWSKCRGAQPENPACLKGMACFKHCVMSKFNTIKLMFRSYDVYNFTVTTCMYAMNSYPFFSRQTLVILWDLPLVLLIIVCSSNFACLQSSKAHALAVSEHYIICGCADGIIR